MKCTSGGDARRCGSSSQRTIDDLQRTLDEALARETGLAEVLRVINSPLGDLAPVVDARRLSASGGASTGELDAHVFEGSVTFTRTTDDARRQAGARILNFIDQVRMRPGRPDMPPAEVAWMIDEEVKAVPRALRLHLCETVEPSRSEASATAGVPR